MGILNIETCQETAVERKSSKAPRVVRQKNMVMSPAGLGTKNDCSGEGQKQFTGP
jgi:hypothetical protein